MICPNCGSICEKGQKFCPECGEPLFQHKDNTNEIVNDDIIFRPLDDDGYEDDISDDKPIFNIDPEAENYLDNRQSDEYEDEDEDDDSYDENKMSGSTALLIVVSCLLVIAIIFAVVYGLTLNKKNNVTASQTTVSAQVTTDPEDVTTTSAPEASTTVTTAPTTESTTEGQTYPDEVRHFVYDNNDIPGKYRPILELSPNGNFELTEVYSGVYLTIKGTYTEDDSNIILNIREYTGVSTDLGLVSTQITYKKSSDSYITVEASSDKLSTAKGNVFTKNENHSIPSADYRSYKNDNLSAKVVSSAGFLNMRTDASLSGSIMIKIPDGATLSYLGEMYDGSWSYVCYSNGESIYYGWVSSEYLSK